MRRRAKRGTPVSLGGPPLDPADPADRAVVWPLGPAIDRADVPLLCDELAMLVRARPDAPVVCDVSAVTRPDAVTVEALARLRLTARRLGCDLRVRGVDPRLHTLIAFVGLADALALGDLPVGSSPVEAGGEAEEREQVRGVEEVRDPGDPPV
jgi:anti-anti-sigma regulatory factor